MRIRAAVADDLESVARIHKARFSHIDYLLGQYSRSLIVAFYRLHLADTVFLVHTNDRGEVDAFVMGGEANTLGAHKRQFARSYAARIAWETFLQPRLWRIAVGGARAMLAPASHQAEQKVDASRAQNMRLLSIAVAENAEGTGAAVALVREFDNTVRRSCEGYELTVLKTNQRARRFYEKLDFVLVRETAQEYVFQKKFHDRSKLECH
jgi:ribosomal protein S18 acetylase RimI-like enzyme